MRQTSLDGVKLTNGCPSRNRTCNCPLGGGRYIHLTMGQRGKILTDRAVIGNLNLNNWLFSAHLQYRLAEYVAAA